MHDIKHSSDRLARPLALGQVERDLKAGSPELAFTLVGQAHFGEPGFAFIEVNGIEDQPVRHRIRKEAGERLLDLGFPVDLIEGKDVFHIAVIQPD